MQILSTGGTMSAIEEQLETIVEHLNALWDNQNNRPIPTDIRWEDYAPEKVMLRFKDELKRLQPYVEGWFSERGKSLPDWPKLYFVPVEGWINYFKAHPDAARLPKGPTRDEWIASRVLYLSALCPWRYTQGIFRFAPSFAKALCSSSLKGDIPCEVFLRLPQWSIYTSRRQRPGMTTPFLSGSGRIFRTGTSRWKSQRSSSCSTWSTKRAGAFFPPSSSHLSR